MSSPVADALRALSRALGTRRWYVFGAQAVLAHGLPRLTADIDVTIECDDRDAVLEALRAELILPRAEGFEALLRTGRLWPLIHRPSQMPVDAVLAASPIERDFLDRAVIVDLGGARVPALSLEDLLATKCVAGRRKDLDDIHGILQQQLAAIDFARLEAVLESFDETLEEPRAVKTFDRARRRFTRKRR